MGSIFISSLSVYVIGSIFAFVNIRLLITGNSSEEGLLELPKLKTGNK
jgi:predicted RecA/RadA family phage recombinase